MKNKKSLKKKIKRFSLRNKKPIHNKNFNNYDINNYISKFLDLKSLISLSKVNQDLKEDLSKTVKIRKQNEYLIKPNILTINDKYHIKDFKDGDIVMFNNPNGFDFIYQIYKNRFNMLIPPNLILPLKYDVNYMLKNYYKYNLPIPILIDNLLKEIITIKIEEDLSLTINLKLNNKKIKIKTKSFNSIQEINDYYYNLLNINRDFYVYVEKNINELQIINKEIYKIIFTEQNSIDLIIKDLNGERVIKEEIDYR